MSASTKLMGLLAGVSAVAVIGVAVAQGVEPNAQVPNFALAAGQQSTFRTGMGETGLPPINEQVRTAIITPMPVAVVAPAPIVIVQAAPVRAPEPVVTVMGAGPAPVEAAPMPAPRVRARRADRN